MVNKVVTHGTEQQIHQLLSQEGVVLDAHWQIDRNTCSNTFIDLEPVLRSPRQTRRLAKIIAPAFIGDDLDLIVTLDGGMSRLAFALSELLLDSRGREIFCLEVKRDRPCAGGQEKPSFWMEDSHARFLRDRKTPLKTLLIDGVWVNRQQMEELTKTLSIYPTIKPTLALAVCAHGKGDKQPLRFGEGSLQVVYFAQLGHNQWGPGECSHCGSGVLFSHRLEEPASLQGS